MSTGARADWEGTEVEFGITDSKYPFVDVSERHACTLEYITIYAVDNGHRTIFEVTDASGATVVETLAESGIGGSVLYSGESEGVVSIACREITECPGTTTFVNGGVITKFRAREGEGTIRAYVPADIDVLELCETIEQYHPTIELRRKRPWNNGAPRADQTVPPAISNGKLTDRQYEILQRAYEAGYFEYPRENNATEIATELGISSPTFAQHIRAAESKIVEQIFERTE
jgi:predicted DNA binding protein